MQGGETPGGRRRLLAGNHSAYSVVLSIGCNASAVQRVADDLQDLISTKRLEVLFTSLLRPCQRILMQ